MRAHATFGLINSTPHSVRSHGRRIAVKPARPLLESMALAALMAPAVPEPPRLSAGARSPARPWLYGRWPSDPHPHVPGALWRGHAGNQAADVEYGPKVPPDGKPAVATDTRQTKQGCRPLPERGAAGSCESWSLDHGEGHARIGQDGAEVRQEP